MLGVLITLASSMLLSFTLQSTPQDPPGCGGPTAAEMPTLTSGCLVKATPHQYQKRKESGEVTWCRTDGGNGQCSKGQSTGLQTH